LHEVTVKFPIKPPFIHAFDNRVVPSITLELDDVLVPAKPPTPTEPHLIVENVIASTWLGSRTRIVRSEATI